MFNPEYMDVQGICNACASCAVCAACAACLFDGPIPDFEGAGIGGLVGVSGVAGW